MKKLLLIATLASCLSVDAQVNFLDITLEEAKALSRKEGKFIFVFAFSDWCEPCQVMDEYTFMDLEVSNYFNQEFVSLRLDMEVYPGVEIAEEYDVLVYPGMLFLDSEGKVIHRGCGAMDSSDFLEFGKQVFGDRNFKSLSKRFEKGDRNPDFLSSYLSFLDEACLNAQFSAQVVMDEISNEALYQESSFLLLEDHQWDIFSEQFQYLLENKTAFEDSLGASRVNDKIFNTYLAQYQEIFESDDLHVFAMRALMNEVKNVSFIGADTLQTMMDLHYHEVIEDWVSYSEDAIAWVGMSETKDSEILSDLAWKFYLFVEDKKKVAIALGWAKQALDLDPSPSSIDTYASLHHKLGNKKEAIELEKQAIELAISLGEETSHFEHQLNKFQND